MLPRIASGLLLISTLTGRAMALDTGHHSDLTRTVLFDLGFNDDAIKAVQVANWLTDFYSAPDSVVTHSEFEKLHADCLFSTADVWKYWQLLAINTKGAVQDAARANDALKFLTIMGLSLHTVQDFYSHSNWVERHPRGGPNYRTNTWWNTPFDSKIDIHTGWYKNALYPSRPREAQDAHGDATSGLNHDFYGRPRWDEAYVFAYAASAEWAEALLGWAREANPSFIGKARSFSLQGSDRERLDYDVTAHYRISEWIYAPTMADGHWKATGSGHAAKFLTFLTAWKASKDSLSVLALKEKKYQLLLTKGLYEPNAGIAVGAIQVIPPVNVVKVAVAVRTLAVAKESSRLSTPVAPNFYAIVTIQDSGRGERRFIEGMQNTPPGTLGVRPSWWTIDFVDYALLIKTNNKVQIRYELHNEDPRDPGYPPPRANDEHFSIKGSKDDDKDLRFSFDVKSHACEGEITGKHDSESNAATTRGSGGYPASVQFYVTANELGGPSGPARP